MASMTRRSCLISYLAARATAIHDRSRMMDSQSNLGEPEGWGAPGQKMGKIDHSKRNKQRKIAEQGFEVAGSAAGEFGAAQRAYLSGKDDPANKQSDYHQGGHKPEKRFGRR